MAAVPQPHAPTAAELAAWRQACDLRSAVSQHRSLLSAMQDSRAGVCSTGWVVDVNTLDGDFDLDPSAMRRIVELAAGPQLRAAPPAAASSGAAAGPSALQNYLFPPPVSGAPWSPERLSGETGPATVGAGNITGNSAAALAGVMQWSGARNASRAFADGLVAIQQGRLRTVQLSPEIELYNAAAKGQRPRPRLRVRGLLVKTVRAAVPATGGPVTQWRFNNAGSAATLKAGSMTAQQVRNTAVLAGERGLPGALRWASTMKGGGVLAFAPSLLLDTYAAIEDDPGSWVPNFNARQWAVDEARNQSGNAVGFVGGWAIGLAAGVFLAGAPVVIIGLAGGVALQVLWNWSGMSDATAGAVEGALR